MLLFDDVQWADDASLELILHFLTRPPEGPAPAGLRAAPGAPSPRACSTPPASVPGFEELTLRAAGRRRRAGDAGRRRDREQHVRDAAGNPLFLRELARAAGEFERSAASRRASGGAGDGRRSRRSRAARRTLGHAVAGGSTPARRADPHAPRDAAGRGRPRGRAARRAGAHAAGGRRGRRRPVRPGARRRRGRRRRTPRPSTRSSPPTSSAPHPGARRFAFRHPLVRRAVYDASPPAWRLAAHERVAAALEARGAGAAVRAYHVTRFARAGDLAAIDVLRARRRGHGARSPATAANWYAAALPLLPEDRRGRCSARSPCRWPAPGRLEESQARLHEALELDPPTAS